MELVSLRCNRELTSASSYGLGWYKYTIATQWYQFHTTDAWWFSLNINVTQTVRDISPLMHRHQDPVLVRDWENNGTICESTCAVRCRLLISTRLKLIIMSATRWSVVSYVCRQVTLPCISIIWRKQKSRGHWDRHKRGYSAVRLEWHGSLRQREHRCRTPRTSGSVVPVRHPGGALPLWESVGMRRGFAPHFRHLDDLFAPQNLTMSTILFRSCWVPFRNPPFSACRRSLCPQNWPNL